MSNILYIIPARGGSKGIPGKNITDVAGKPLIAWTIEAALKAAHRGRVVVSSDDEAIIRVAKELGAEAPFRRPALMSTDSAPTLDALIHAVKFYQQEAGFPPDIVVCLQPTSPLRTAGDIDKALDIYLERKNGSVVSVTQAKHHPSLMRVLDGGHLVPYDASGATSRTRQEMAPVYVLNGAIYVSSAEVVLSGSVLAPVVYPYIMPHAASVDIDEPDDLAAAIWYLENRKS